MCIAWNQCHEVYYINVLSSSSSLLTENITAQPSIAARQCQSCATIPRSFRPGNLSGLSWVKPCFLVTESLVVTHPLMILSVACWMGWSPAVSLIWSQVSQSFQQPPSPGISRASYTWWPQHKAGISPEGSSCNQKAETGKVSARVQLLKVPSITVIPFCLTQPQNQPKFSERNGLHFSMC